MYKRYQIMLKNKIHRKLIVLDLIVIYPRIIDYG